MNKKYFTRGVLYLLAMMALVNCKTPYDPPLKAIQSNSLVVEGFIDGAAPTVIKLSRTRMISAGDTARVKNELCAKVFVVDDQQNRYALVETGGGLYSSNVVLNLNPGNPYRLYINTGDNKEYVSDFVDYKQSPAIDSVGWKLKNDGIQFYVNTHDENNATRYYRWEYHETWEYHSIFPTGLQYNRSTDEVVPMAEQIYTCWGDAKSNRIILGSSAKLSDDVIYQAPLVDIENHSKKMSVLYSILVKQYALDITGFNYWEAMRNNTENVGSIFDPQPNQTVGNIHSLTTPSETVVGYIGAGSSFTKRYFVYNRDMPGRWNIFPRCDEINVTKDSTRFYFDYGGLLPVSEYLTNSGATAYTGAAIACVDCRLEGTNVKPDFWP